MASDALPHGVESLKNSAEVPRAQLAILQEQLTAVHVCLPQLVRVRIRTLVHLSVHRHGICVEWRDEGRERERERGGEEKKRRVEDREEREGSKWIK